MYESSLKIARKPNMSNMHMRVCVCVCTISYMHTCVHKSIRIDTETDITCESSTDIGVLWQNKVTFVNMRIDTDTRMTSTGAFVTLNERTSIHKHTHAEQVQEHSSLRRAQVSTCICTQRQAHISKEHEHASP